MPPGWHVDIPQGDYMPAVLVLVLRLWLSGMGVEGSTQGQPHFQVSGPFFLSLADPPELLRPDTIETEFQLRLYFLYNVDGSSY